MQNVAQAYDRTKGIKMELYLCSLEFGTHPGQIFKTQRYLEIHSCRCLRLVSKVNRRKGNISYVSIFYIL